MWVPSPVAGSDLIVAEGLSLPMSFDGNGIHCASARIATMLSESRSRMDARIERRRSDWPNERRTVETARVKPPEEAARVGISPDRIIRATVWDSLHTTLFDGVAAAIRTLLTPLSSVSLGTGNKKPTGSPTTTRTAGSASLSSTPTTTRCSTPALR